MTFYKGLDSKQKHNADEIKKFIKAGWIDSLHTLGDFSTTNETSTSFNRLNKTLVLMELLNL